VGFSCHGVSGRTSGGLLPGRVGERAAPAHRGSPGSPVFEDPRRPGRRRIGPSAMAAPQDARAGPVTGFAGPVAPGHRALPRFWPTRSRVILGACPQAPPSTRHDTPDRTSHPSAAVPQWLSLNGCEMSAHFEPVTLLGDPAALSPHRSRPAARPAPPRKRSLSLLSLLGSVPDASTPL
jgi:hypothetical protein